MRTHPTIVLDHHLYNIDRDKALRDSPRHRLYTCTRLAVLTRLDPAHAVLGLHSLSSNWWERAIGVHMVTGV